ncbi:MAG: EAL domain-containing protein [Methylocapsa sp.]|nr:EAL domain-containing protein [Methylocapsa sp.]
MLAVYNCVANAHDLRLVLLAAAICALASYAAISLLHHMRRSNGRMRYIWLAVSAISTGGGIWSTHFIAMLAFTPGVPSAYNIALTALSLIAAIALTGAGLAAATASPSAKSACLGGAMAGGGIATMHYIGMAAFEIQGRIAWDPVLVAASILLGASLGAAALAAGLRADKLSARLLGALLLTLAICSHHFTAMAAATVVPGPSFEFSAMALPSGKLAIAVAGVSLAMVNLTLAGIAIEMRIWRQETARMRHLANAAIEGLMICAGEIIVSVNDSFAALAGLSAGRIAGLALEHFFPEESTRGRLLQAGIEPAEGELRQADGARIPVELVMRRINLTGRSYWAIAVRDLRARKQAEQKIHYLAHYDTLTGIFNRNSFNDKLDQEIQHTLASGRQLALLCLDLDHFKEVNDLFGHAAGDKLLQLVTQRIHNILDSNQTIARLGGDEFAIIVPGLRNPEGARRIARRIIETLQTPPPGPSAPAPVSATIGIALCPDDAGSREELIACADAALYRAKSDGRGAYCFFEASIGAAVKTRRALEHDLRHAIARKECRAVYQPVMDIRSGKFIGFEALLRWEHPSRGEISPAEFIPLAEETGLILPLGDWVLREACREAASWAEPLSVAVNVSTAQIHDAHFSSRVHEILFETGLKPSRLELEITETALIRDMPRALATLSRIKVLGVRVAMDDFGTGYSSLSNLRAFPFDKIKIDKSFVKAVNSNGQGAAIVRSVLGLSHALHLPVVAEGVETQAELAFLAAEACDLVQGYLLGKPSDIAAFRALTHPGALALGHANVVPLMARAAS